MRGPETSLGEDSNLENVSLCTYLSDVSWYVYVRCTDPPQRIMTCYLTLKLSSIYDTLKAMPLIQ